MNYKLEIYWWLYMHSVMLYYLLQLEKFETEDIVEFHKWKCSTTNSDVRHKHRSISLLSRTKSIYTDHRKKGSKWIIKLQTML